MMLATKIMNAVAISTMLLLPAFASPITPRTPSVRLTSSDHWNSTAEDLVTWQDRMIAAGKMYRPSVTSMSGSVSIHTRDILSYDLTNVACGFVGGTNANYELNRQGFCALIGGGKYATYLGLERIVQGEIDTLGEDVTAFFLMSLDAAQWYTNGGFGVLCAAVFDEIYNQQCPGGTGGSATISLTSQQLGSTSGSIEAQNFAGDGGATCPATPLAQSYCEVVQA